MERLKILWLSHFVPYPPKGGCFQRSYNLIRETSKENDIYLVASRHKDKSNHPESEMQKAKEELEKFCKKVLIVDISSFSGLNLYYIALKSIFTGDPMTVNLFKSRAMQRTIKRIVKEINFDVVHFDTISLAMYYNDTGNLSKVLTHHGMESFMIRRRADNESNIFKKLYLLIEAYKLCKYEKNNCYKFNYNIMVSENDKSMLEKISPSSRIEVVENGVDVKFFLPKNDHSNTHRLIFAGRMDQYSNMNAIMTFCTNVWPLIKERFPRMKFTVIGNNPPKKLLEIARDDDALEILGYVDDVRPFFRESTIFVCPIQDGGGTRIKILDAMAMGMPIVSTTIGCEGIYVTSGENILIADTPIEFVECIGRITSDRKLREKLSENARITVEKNYSWEILGEKLNCLYANIFSSI